MTRNDWAQFPATVRRVGLEVLVHGPLARTELADRLHLSTASLSRLTKPLLQAGLIQERGEAESNRTGRPMQPLEVNSRAQQFIGIKLTGTHAHAARTDLRATIEASITRPLQSTQVDDVVALLSELVQDLRGQATLSGVGVGIGGLVRDFSTVASASFLNWSEIDLAPLLTDELDVPVTVTNDIDSLVEAENWFGHGRECENFAVLTIGAGIGCGLVAHDRLVTSPDAGLGLIGHLPLDSSGPECPDGHRGCANAYLGMHSLIAQSSIATGRPLSYEEVLQFAVEGDPIIDSIVGIAAQRLGGLIATIASITLAQRIILTGEGVQLATAASTRMHEGMMRHRHPRATPIDLVIADHDATLWARGAAAVAIQRTVLAEPPTVPAGGARRA